MVDGRNSSQFVPGMHPGADPTNDKQPLPLRYYSSRCAVLDLKFGGWLVYKDQRVLRAEQSGEDSVLVPKMVFTVTGISHVHNLTRPSKSFCFFSICYRFCLYVWLFHLLSSPMVMSCS